MRPYKMLTLASLRQTLVQGSALALATCLALLVIFMALCPAILTTMFLERGLKVLSIFGSFTPQS